MKKAVPYYRVSTERQGSSGLGLAAQREAVRRFANSAKYQLLKEYREIESGKINKRPILLRAIEECKKQDATLLIAKLDRLGRNVAFISRLMESGIDFIAVDNPAANKFIVHIMAAFAEYERDQISIRTKEALAAAKSRGVVLGSYGINVQSKRNIKVSEAFAKKLHPTITRLRKSGISSTRTIRDELNRQQVPTFRNKGRWHTTTVYNLLKRIESLNLK